MRIQRKRWVNFFRLETRGLEQNAVCFHHSCQLYHPFHIYNSGAIGTRWSQTREAVFGARRRRSVEQSCYKWNSRRQMWGTAFVNLLDYTNRIILCLVALVPNRNPTFTGEICGHRKEVYPGPWCATTASCITPETPRSSSYLQTGRNRDRGMDWGSQICV